MLNSGIFTARSGIFFCMGKLFLGIALFLCLTSLSVFAQREKTDPLKAGDTAPDFSLTDENGKAVTLSSLEGTTVVVFYRAYWCPFCVRQLSQLRSLKQAGDNFNIVAISPDPANRLQETRAKVAKDGKGEINFPLLSDPGSKTVNAYGVYDPTYAGQDVDGIPHPSIFILDQNRKVSWVSVSMDYKKRPTNEEIRAELGKLR